MLAAARSKLCRLDMQSKMDETRVVCACQLKREGHSIKKKKKKI